MNQQSLEVGEYLVCLTYRDLRCLRLLTLDSPGSPDPQLSPRGSQAPLTNRPGCMEGSHLTQLQGRGYQAPGTQGLLDPSPQVTQGRCLRILKGQTTLQMPRLHPLASPQPGSHRPSSLNHMMRLREESWKSSTVRPIYRGANPRGQPFPLLHPPPHKLLRVNLQVTIPARL